MAKNFHLQSGSCFRDILHLLVFEYRPVESSASAIIGENMRRTIRAQQALSLLFLGSRLVVTRAPTRSDRGES